MSLMRMLMAAQVVSGLISPLVAEVRQEAFAVNATSHTINLGPVVQVGDLMLLHCSSGNGGLTGSPDTSIGLPAGWTALLDGSKGRGYFRWAYKIATSGDPNAALTLNLQSAAYLATQLVVIRAGTYDPASITGWADSHPLSAPEVVAPRIPVPWGNERKTLFIAGVSSCGKPEGALPPASPAGYSAPYVSFADLPAGQSTLTEADCTLALREAQLDEEPASTFIFPYSQSVNTTVSAKIAIGAADTVAFNGPVLLSVTPTAATANAANVAMPAAVNPGDLLIMFGGWDDADTPTLPAGWTRFEHVRDPDNSAVIYYKVADGSEAGTTVTITLQSSESFRFQVFRIQAGTYATPDFFWHEVKSENITDNYTAPVIEPYWGKADTLFMSLVLRENWLTTQPRGYLIGYKPSEIHRNSGDTNGGGLVGLTSVAALRRATENFQPKFTGFTNAKVISTSLAIKPVSAAAIAAPTGDRYYDKTVSLAYLTGTPGDTVFPDEKGRVYVPNGGAVISNVQSRFGGGSLALNGTNAFLVCNDPEILPGTQDFTLEGAFYCGPGTTSQIFWHFDGAGISFYRANNTILLFANGSNLINVASPLPLASNWRWLSLNYNAGLFRVAVDGVSLVNVAAFSAGINSGRLLLGASGTAGAEGNFFNGYVNSVRMTIGKARNLGTFAPPSSQLPNF